MLYYFFFPPHTGDSGNECIVEISLYVCSLCMAGQIDSNIAQDELL